MRHQQAAQLAARLLAGFDRSLMFATNIADRIVITSDLPLGLRVALFRESGRLLCAPRL